MHRLHVGRPLGRLWLVVRCTLASGCSHRPRPTTPPRRRPPRVTRLTVPAVTGLFRHFHPERRSFSWPNASLAALASLAAVGAERPTRGLAAFFRKLSSLFTVARHLRPRYLKNIWQHAPPAARRGLPTPSRFTTLHP